MNDEREIAGIRCGQVLAELSDYFDGDLTPARRGAIEAHVRACDLCARFGGVFAATLRSLRERLGATSRDVAADALPADVARRLAETLRRAREG